MATDDEHPAFARFAKQQLASFPQLDPYTTLVPAAARRHGDLSMPSSDAARKVTRQTLGNLHHLLAVLLSVQTMLLLLFVNAAWMIWQAMVGSLADRRTELVDSLSRAVG